MTDFSWLDDAVLGSLSRDALLSVSTLYRDIITGMMEARQELTDAFLKVMERNNFLLTDVFGRNVKDWPFFWEAAGQPAATALKKMTGIPVKPGLSKVLTGRRKRPEMAIMGRRKAVEALMRAVPGRMTAMMKTEAGRMAAKAQKKRELPQLDPQKVCRMHGKTVQRCSRCRNTC